MIYVPARTIDDWQPLVANEIHWQDNCSAKNLAVAWQNTKGFPESIKMAMNSNQNLKDYEMIFGIPEFVVPLPGGGHGSQNDLFVLAGSDTGLCTIMVEGKVDEDFGPTVKAKKITFENSKTNRLNYLCSLLQLQSNQVDQLRYQLLHRTASAVLTAKKFHCNTAAVLVHSFSDKNSHFDDFEAFLKIYNLNAVIGSIVGPVEFDGVSTYWGWINS